MADFADNRDSLCFVASRSSHYLMGNVNAVFIADVCPDGPTERTEVAVALLLHNCGDDSDLLSLFQLQSNFSDRRKSFLIILNGRIVVGSYSANFQV